jgi:hypothetical protein
MLESAIDSESVAKSARLYSMIPKSGHRFSEKIMLQKRQKTG